MKKIRSNSIEDTEKTARDLVAALGKGKKKEKAHSTSSRSSLSDEPQTSDVRPEDSVPRESKTEQATVVGLYGELGSGKTTFMKSVAKEFGITEIVTSPTFIIQKAYPIEHKKFSQLYHIDAYRLTSGDELLTLGWEGVLGNPQNIVFIEWPEYVASALPTNISKVTFTTVGENTRDIEMTLL